MKFNFTKHAGLKITAYLFLVCMVLGVHSAYAQSRVLSGLIKDETGAGIPGVNIIKKGSSSGTISDIEGRYTIEVDDTTVLTFSMIGYTKIEEVVGNRNVIDLSMQVDVQQLDEVVVVGYGTEKKRDLTGSVGLANMDNLQKAPVASFEEALGGRIAGVQVSSSEGQPGDNMNIVIRGLGSITQGTSPLFVIDGVPIENPPSGIIDQTDIETISVLKDASAAAIYGARGANGVVIITTKSGKEGATRITYDTYFGISSVRKRMDMLTPYEYVELQNELAPETVSTTYLAEKTLEDYRNETPTNWQDEVFQDATIKSHKISLDGGSKKNTLYSINLSAFNQEGVIINSGFDRYIGKLRIDQRVNDKLKVGMYVNYSRTKQYGTRTSTSGHNFSTYLLHSVLAYRPVGYDESVNLLEEEIDPDIDPLNNYQFNPVLSAQNEHRETINNNIILNGNAEYTFMDGLKLRIDAGYVSFGSKLESFNNSQTRYGSPNSSLGKGPNGYIRNTTTATWNTRAYLTYDAKLSGGHKLRVMAGSELQERSFDQYRFSATQVTVENNNVNGLDSGIPELIATDASRSRLRSYLARVNYSFKNRYFVTANLRRDGSSKFSSDNRWGLFPSVALAWQMGDEAFMKEINFIGDFKVRASWGQLGNNRVSDFASKASLGYTNLKYAPTGFPIYYAFNNSLQLGVAPNSLENRDLKWEIGEETNIGVDFGLFDNRFGVSVDAYRKETKDLLLNAQLPTTTGYRSAFKNIGAIENKGLEITLTSVNMDVNDFKWTTDFNISFNKNKVLELNEDQTTLASTVSWTNRFSNISGYVSKVGQPIGLMYGYVWDGIYQYDEFDEVSDGVYVLKPNVVDNGQSRGTIQPGFIKYKDINGDGIVNDNDRTIIGDPTPKHIGGLANNFSYKGISLHVFFQWSYGNDIMNANRIYLEAPYKRNSNMFATVADRWTPENPSETMFSSGQPEAGLQKYSSRIVEDGSFLRLKTVSVSYNFPKQLISKLKLTGARVYMSAQNLHTWTSYSGYDPEVSVRNSALTRGFDFSAYPRAKTMTMGVNITL